MTAGPLAGRGVVVTRPHERAETLAAMIREAGGEALVFPAIEIRELEDLRPFFAIADRLGEFDLAIFISPNAVARAMELLRRRRGDAPWPPGLAVAAIGSGSRRELERLGFGGVIAPGAQADSEALLALPGLARVSGKRVVIFRGEGGRELLAGTLAARGATVEYAECYRRVRPDADPGMLLAAWARGAVSAVTVSSTEALANLFESVGEHGREWLRKTPLVVPHARVAEEAKRRGAREVLLAGPGDAETVARLVAYFAGSR